MSRSLGQWSRNGLYQSLNPDTPTIRLLTLHPGDWDAPISCHLFTTRLTDACSYKALSYCWKTDGDSPDVDISCNLRTLTISSNLNAALKRLRQDPANRRIWVDAICINQQDDAERTYQVGLMRDIYHLSAEVLIWLGEQGLFDALSESVGKVVPGGGNDDDNLNLTTWSGDAGDMSKLKWYFSPTAEAHRAKTFSSYTNDVYGAFCILHLLSSGVAVDKIWHLRQPKYSAPIVRGLDAVIRKAWWQRIWVVQETVVARKATVWYGNMSAPWQLFSSAVIEYDKSRMRTNASNFITQLDSGHVLMQYTRVIMDIESTRRDWGMGKPMQLLPLLRKFRARLSSDSRDKVFAILGLIRSWVENQRLDVDYSLDFDTLSLDTTLFLIRSTRSLAVLAGTLQGIEDAESSGGRRRPGWITDWSCSPSTNEHIRLGSIHLYNASRGIMGRVAVHMPGILETQACRFDRIILTGREMPIGEGRSRMRLAVSSWEEHYDFFASVYNNNYGGGAGDDNDNGNYDDDDNDENRHNFKPRKPRSASASDAFWRTLCCDLEYVSNSGPTSANIDTAVAEGEGGGGGGGSHIYSRKFRRLDDDDLSGSRAAYKQWRWASRDSNRRTSIIDNHWLEPPEGESVSETRNVYNYILDCTSGGRSFFVTEKGYIGTGPPGVRPEDTISVLLGSRVPFVLRSIDGATSATGGAAPRKCHGAEVRTLFTETARERAGADAARPVAKVETEHCHEAHWNCYQVVGDAYVHGAMDGSIVANATHGFRAVESVFLI
ncbi:hypothetical protein DL764_007330 [Monosporascus ibericus]|uniref:Heterokaryon incompatibility domain-containing protein n=1 Tax=Monosporascus ibericus TaxID=155417 RepID=A0A4V1X9R1_9PEZI|nr:hypothetical protein DL764_007330 [Monosporascus ibericus]